jgi:hypothetical protein
VFLKSSYQSSNHLSLDDIVEKAEANEPTKEKKTNSSMFLQTATPQNVTYT